jgi:hypothetical protein
MRAGIVGAVTRADRRWLEAIVAHRSAPQRHVWPANIILATADGYGAAEIMRRSGKSKRVVSRWQARFMAEGVDGLLRDKTRKPGKPPRPFKLSTDPNFAAKLKDVDVDPPDHAVILSVDEKSQIQALDRAQPGLPMKPGRAGTMTHDYKRNGTTSLFAALNILDGTVIGRKCSSTGTKVHPLPQHR